MTKIIRFFAVIGVFFASAIAASAQTQGQEPAAIVTSIYKKASAGKGDSGGEFLWLKAKDRARSMSKSLSALWAKVEKKEKPGEMGAIAFDPVTNSQDPLVRFFDVKTEKQDDTTAAVAAADAENGRFAHQVAVIGNAFGRHMGARRIVRIAPIHTEPVQCRIAPQHLRYLIQRLLMLLPVRNHRLIRRRLGGWVDSGRRHHHRHREGRGNRQQGKSNENGNGSYLHDSDMWQSGRDLGVIVLMSQNVAA